MVHYQKVAAVGRVPVGAQLADHTGEEHSRRFTPDVGLELIVGLNGLAYLATQLAVGCVGNGATNLGEGCGPRMRVKVVAKHLLLVVGEGDGCKSSPVLVRRGNVECLSCHGFSFLM